MRILRSVLIAAAVAATAAPLAAQQVFTVSGRVTTPAGTPVSGAQVTLQGAAAAEAVTSQTGGYRFAGLAPGGYTVEIGALGFTSETVSLTITDAPVHSDVVLTEGAVALAPLTAVGAMRTGTSAAALPIKVEVIESRELAVQRSLSGSPAELLSNVIPSFSPARQKLSGAGESFRGRRPLFLIDGIPQSNPLRDGRRDGFTIDGEAVERVEVVFGANAIQGLGATGGIVNYVTVSPSISGELEQRASASFTADDGFEEHGVGWRGHYLATKRMGRVDVVGSLSYESRGLQYDAQGRAIAIDNVQGDVADSRAVNALAKLGWEPASGHRLQFMVNGFRLAQRGGFASVEGDRAAGIPATSNVGEPEGTEPVNDVTTAAVDYENVGFAGGTISAKAYWQNFSALFGGGRFATFQDPAIAPVGELFDQSENNSEKLGTRLTWAGRSIADRPVDVVGGFDILRDRTWQRLVQTDRNWVPVTTFINYAPFAQVDVRAGRLLSLSGGVRWEIAKLDVPDFVTLAGNRSDFQPVLVAGGSPSFDEPLFNVGAVLTPVQELRIYGTLSQAYTMPDVGRVLRGISTEGTSVDDFLNLQPIETDNVELGAAFGTRAGQVRVTWFRSEAELGSRLVANADGIFQVRREPTRTWGWEVSGRLDAWEPVALSAAYSFLEGRYDSDGDGGVDSDLGAADVGPDRLNLSADINPRGWVRGRLQSFTFFDETLRDAAGNSTASFDGYTLVDASVSTTWSRATTLTLAVSNLLDTQYITYFAQAASTRNDQFFAGRGRALTLRVEQRF